MVFSNRFSIFSFIFLFFVLNSCKTKTQQNQKKATTYSFIEFEKGSHSNIQKEKQLVITNRETLEQVYTTINQSRTPHLTIPEINFEKEMLIALFMGSKNSSGYSIGIDSIVIGGKRIKIYIKETKPNGMAASVMTQPYYIAKTKKFNKNLDFIKLSEKNKM